MGLGCLDVPERRCERLAVMCVMARRGVLERELEERMSRSNSLQIIFVEENVRFTRAL